VGHKEPGSVEVFFTGPFKGEVIINFPGHPFGVVPVDPFDSVANFIQNGQVTSVIYFQISGFGEQFVNFDNSISNNPFRLLPVPQTPIPLVGPEGGPKVPQILQFVGPDDLLIKGNVTSFSAVLNPVTEVDSTALLLLSALVVLGFLRRQATKSL
jgi:hypothetical protein